MLNSHVNRRKFLKITAEIGALSSREEINKLIRFEIIRGTITK